MTHLVLAVLSALMAQGTLETKAQAEEFFREYFAHLDAGKVPPEDPGSFRELGEGGLSYTLGALDNEKHRIVALRLLGAARTKADVSPHLFRFLDAADEHVRCTTAVALGKIGSEASTPRLLLRLGDPDASVVRWACWAVGRCGGSQAGKKLIDFYKNGETHNAWGYHVKSEILWSLYNLKEKEALPLCYREMTHENPTIFETAVRLTVELADDERTREQAGERLLEVSKTKGDPRKLYWTVWGLGRLKHAQALPYIASVYRQPELRKHANVDTVVADALANIETPECAGLLMEIYLKTEPLDKMWCIDGEPILPCLHGLKAISGKDFGDDRAKWKAWYDAFRKKEK